MDTLASYDELPYDSLPLPETQPDFLAAMARLHGFDAPDPRRARILELGCAQGGNLIPLAWRWPESACVGVELSRVQAEAGSAFIAQLGVGNVRIVHGDLTALPDDIGQFDYIIAHGVFSWVLPEVQQALLEVCRRHLSARGVAYISFNVAAGWARLQPLRTALRERTSASLPAPRRYKQAMQVLHELEAEWSDPLVRREIDYLKTASPSYLFHEYLADFNMPLAFAEFAAQLDAHGLRYLGEAGPRSAIVELEDAWGLVPEGMAGRWLDAEAALDEAHATRFRRALVARADAPCAQPPQAEALSSLLFYADLHSDDEIDLGDVVEQFFLDPAGMAFPVAQPALKAGLMALSAVYPDALSYPGLLAAARHVMGEYGVAGAIDETAFRDALFQVVIAHGVFPTVSETAYASEPGEHPCANALARLQAGLPNWAVTGVRHVTMELDEPGRILLGLLDGHHTLDELVSLLQPTLAEVGLDMPREIVRDLAQRQLWLFARQGLLAKPARGMPMRK